MRPGGDETSTTTWWSTERIHGAGCSASSSATAGPAGPRSSRWRRAGGPPLTRSSSSGRGKRTDAALRRAVTLESEGRIDEAAALYRQVLEVRPGSARAWVDLGNAEATRRRADEAERAYRRALEISPDDRDALNNLAWLLLEEGTRLEEAEALAAKAVSQPRPDRPLVLDTLGRIQLARGRCPEAARTFGEALAVAEGLPEPTLARLREGLARAREGCGPATR